MEVFGGRDWTCCEHTMFLGNGVFTICLYVADLWTCLPYCNLAANQVAFITLKSGIDIHFANALLLYQSYPFVVISIIFDKI